MEQEFPQKVVYTGIRIMGHEDQFRNSVHLSHGRVRLPETAFSGRKGTWIGYHTDYVINVAVKKALEEVMLRNPDLDRKTSRNVAEIIGVGAVKYYLAASKPERGIVFNWDDALNLQGTTAPYIQYSYLRAKNILDKVNKLPTADDEFYFSQFGNYEVNLVKKISGLPRSVIDVCINYSPNLMANYAYSLAQTFNAFYEHSPVLIEKDPKYRKAKLALVATSQQTINNTLDFLKINLPTLM
jgi:arginyl-tRNA synthetase